MSNRVNKYRCPGAKRLMVEALELKEKTEDYCAQPIEDNLFEWHFTIKGPPDTAFENGFYHGILSFPSDYPMKPPSIILLTPNGRFETNKKICLSISGYHPETWQPSWSVRTALLALIAFMPTNANRAIGSLSCSDAERKKLASRSRTWCCETCGPIRDLLKHPDAPNPDTLKSNDSSNNEISEANKSSDGREPSSNSNTHNVNSDNSSNDQNQNPNPPASNEQVSVTSQSSTTEKLPSSSSSSSDEAQHSVERTDSDQVVVERLKLPPGHHQASVEQTADATTTGAPGSVVNGLSEDRRAHPSIVFKSIFFLLFLLVLRRIVMFVQL